MIEDRTVKQNKKNSADENTANGFQKSIASETATFVISMFV